MKIYTSICTIALIGTLAVKGPLQVPKMCLDHQEGFLLHPSCPISFSHWRCMNSSLLSDSLQRAPTGVARIVHSRICSRETIGMDCISMCLSAAAAVPQYFCGTYRACNTQGTYCHFEPALCCAWHNSFKYLKHFKWKNTWHYTLMSQRHCKVTTVDLTKC